MSLRLVRCGLVVLAVTVAAAAALHLLAPVASSRGPDFEALLVSGCAAVACACTVWAWLSALAVVVEALRATGDVAPRPTPGVPAAVRRLVLGACGVALAAGAAPALATPGHDAPQGPPAVLAGLPFPGRAMDLPAQSREASVVRPGDSLWAIAERRLPPDASDAEISTGWRAIYQHNKAVVGDDPDLIRPGQHLVLPDDLQELS